MKNITSKSDSSQPAAETAVYLFDDWFDPIEAGVRDRVREFIQAMVEGELDAALMRPRYGRRSQSSSGDADGPVMRVVARGGDTLGSVRILDRTVEAVEALLPHAAQRIGDGERGEQVERRVEPAYGHGRYYERRRYHEKCGRPWAPPPQSTHASRYQRLTSLARSHRDLHRQRQTTS